MRAATLLFIPTALALHPPFQAGPGYSLPRTPIAHNAAYLASLADAGVISRAPLAASPDPLHVSAIHGVSYIPSTARNALMHWWDYSPSLTRTELAFAAAATANTVWNTTRGTIAVRLARRGSFFFDDMAPSISRARRGLEVGLVGTGAPAL